MFNLKWLKRATSKESVMESVVVNVPDFKETYTLIDLSFGHYGKTAELAWEKCREYFHLRFDRVDSKNNDFFFYHKISHIWDKASGIIKEVECILNLEIKTLFRKTNHNCVMNILPSPFWKEDRMRMQFLTILLRASKFYDKDYISALKEYEYSKTTMNAVEFFMLGFNKTNSNFDDKIAANMGYGWHYHFNDSIEKCSESISKNPGKLLVKPNFTEDKRKEELKKIAYEINKINNKSESECWDLAVRYHQEKDPLLFHSSRSFRSYPLNHIVLANLAIEFCT